MMRGMPKRPTELPSSRTWHTAEPHPNQGGEDVRSVSKLTAPVTAAEAFRRTRRCGFRRTFRGRYHSAVFAQSLAIGPSQSTRSRRDPCWRLQRHFIPSPGRPGRHRRECRPPSSPASASGTPNSSWASTPLMPIGSTPLERSNEARDDIVEYLRGLFSDGNFNAGTLKAPPETTLRVLTPEVVLVSAHLQVEGRSWWRRGDRGEGQPLLAGPPAPGRRHVADRVRDVQRRNREQTYEGHPDRNAAAPLSPSPGDRPHSKGFRSFSRADRIRTFLPRERLLDGATLDPAGLRTWGRGDGAMHRSLPPQP